MGQKALSEKRPAAGPLGRTEDGVDKLPGRFLTFEGGEGAGKTTQMRLLARALEEAGIALKATREPGGSKGAEAIRRLLVEGESERWDAVSETLLFLAARRDHVRRVIAPSLASGIWVLCDRFSDSTLAYQGYGKGLSLSFLNALNRFAVGDLVPDLTFILDVPVAIGLMRAAGRGAANDRFETLERDFHERLRRGFRRIAARERERCVLIDASAEIEAVHRALLDAVAERLGVPLPRR